MTDESVHENDQHAEPVPAAPSVDPAETPDRPTTIDDEPPFLAEQTEAAAHAMPDEPTPAEPAHEPEPIAHVDDAPAEEELPEDLRGIAEVLEQPTSEIVGLAPLAAAAAAPADEAVSAPTAEADGEAAAAEGAEAVTEGAAIAEAFDAIEPGTLAGEGEAAEGEAPPEGEGEAGSEAEGEPAEGDAVATEAAATEDVAEGEEAALEVDLGPKTTVSWWPFVGYIVVWIAAAAYAVWQLQPVPNGQGIYEPQLYGLSLEVALGLLAAGPILLLIVWLASWIGKDDVRIGSMFISALIKGATATFAGGLIWWIALMVLDYLRLGKVY